MSKNGVNNSPTQSLHPYIPASQKCSRSLKENAPRSLFESEQYAWRIIVVSKKRMVRHSSISYKGNMDLSEIDRTEGSEGLIPNEIYHRYAHGMQSLSPAVRASAMVIDNTSYLVC